MGERASIKETSSLSQSRKGPTRCYGATRQPQSAHDFKLVSHVLSSSDTLQGLAIRYGVTVEQIRRVNKLWTSDNILIYRTLNIPVKVQTESSAGDHKGEGVNLEDINVHVKDKEKDCDRMDGVCSAVNPKNGQSLSKYLNKLDDQMKVSIKQAEKQRTDSGQALINDLETNLEKSTEDHTKIAECKPKKIPKQTLLSNKSRGTSQYVNNQLDRVDDLFEL